MVQRVADEVHHRVAHQVQKPLVHARLLAPDFQVGAFSQGPGEVPDHPSKGLEEGPNGYHPHVLHIFLKGLADHAEEVDLLSEVSSHLLNPALEQLQLSRALAANCTELAANQVHERLHVLHLPALVVHPQLQRYEFVNAVDNLIEEGDGHPDRRRLSGLGRVRRRGPGFRKTAAGAGSSAGRWGRSDGIHLGSGSGCSRGMDDREDNIHLILGSAIEERAVEEVHRQHHRLHHGRCQGTLREVTEHLRQRLRHAAHQRWLAHRAPRDLGCLLAQGRHARP